MVYFESDCNVGFVDFFDLVSFGKTDLKVREQRIPSPGCRCIGDLAREFALGTSPGSEALLTTNYLAVPLWIR